MANDRSNTMSEEIASDVDSSPTIDPLAQTGQQVVEDAGHLASRTADIGLRQADRGREQAARSIERVAQSIRRVSTDLELEQPAVANAANVAADGFERGARFLQTHDARGILNSVENAARRQPLLFLGASFAAGVAASRFIKAGSQRVTEQSASNGNRAALGTTYRASQRYEATGPGVRVASGTRSGEDS
jgi:hypothetical protein